MARQLKIGLKLYSTDTGLINESTELLQKVFFNYIELYIIPGSFNNTIPAWKGLECPYVIHAPHSIHGMNFAHPDMQETNELHFREAQYFADSLSADIIIVHGGNNGSFDETIRQIGLLNDKRIALENKPKRGINNEVCVGWSPNDFHKALESQVINKTVLDFGHAAVSAIASGIEVMNFVRNFTTFNPAVYHLSDCDISSGMDNHLNFGKGNLNLDRLLSFVPEGALLTIETPRDPLNSLKDFKNDVLFLRNLLKDKAPYTVQQIGQHD